MECSEIKVPFLDKKEIKKRADSFRREFWDNLLPIDIEKIIQGKLKMRIVPTSNLRRDCDTDALIALNLQVVYVDNDMYIDDRQQNRLRFSLAHEIGHFILHQAIYSGFKFNNVYEYSRVISEEISERQYGYLETQANKFASYLLVSREKLEIEKNNIIAQLKTDKEFSKITDRELKISYLAGLLANIFGVSSEVMEIILSERPES